MKALSVRQPYAGLIIAGIKNVENRTRSPSGSIGMLAIVSTAKPESAFWFNQARDKVRALGYTFPERLCSINGAVIGVVTFDFCVWQADDGATETDHPAIEPEELTAWWKPDYIGFIFENPRRLAVPIPASGMMGIYTLPGDIERAVLEQFSKTS